MPYYEAGDKVIVRKDLNEDDVYFMFDESFFNEATDEMIDLAGRKVTIQKIEMGQYVIKECSYLYWTDEMFEPPHSKEPDSTLLMTIY